MGRLNRPAVIAAAIQLMEQAGMDSLTVPALAKKLKIRPPSLYNHIESISDLRRELSIHANQVLTERVREAGFGKAGPAALRAMANALRRYALQHPGLYRLSIHVPPKTDQRWMDAFMGFRHLWFSAFDEYPMPKREKIYAARTIRSLVHGFVDLETSGGWLEDMDLKQSFEQAVDRVIQGVGISRTEKTSANARRQRNP